MLAQYNLANKDERDELGSLDLEAKGFSIDDLDDKSEDNKNTNGFLEKSESTSLTKNQKRFKEACRQIANTSPNDSKSLGYYPPYLSKTTLPMVKSKELVFERENGSLKLTMTAHPDYGLPYGKVARRLLIHLVTYSVVNKTDVVPVVSFRQLAKDLGMLAGGKTNKRIHDMILRLLGVTMFVTSENTAGESIEVNRCGILDSVSITNDPSKPKQIVLDAKFFEICKQSAAPIDTRVARAIQSPIEFDLYVFLLARLLTVSSLTKIPWSNFMKQFGCSNKNAASAKQRLKKAINKLILIQPQMNVEYTDKYVVLKPSARAIKTRAGAAVLAGTIGEADQDYDEDDYIYNDSGDIEIES